MSELPVQLFRVHVDLRASLFPQPSPSEVLRKSVESKPSAQVRRGGVWHIGNIERIDDDSDYFRVGRTSRATLGQFDELRGEFLDTELEDAPYTHVLIDYNLELCGIAKRSRLSPTVTGIARQLARVLNDCNVAQEFFLRFSIEPIVDPQDFIEHLQKSYSVHQFKIGFRRPNAFDVDQDFLKPMQSMLRASEGNRGQTMVSGRDLDRRLLEQLARSAAATGDFASAKVRETPDSPSTSKSLSENPIEVRVIYEDTSEQRKTLLERIRAAYNAVRNKQ